MHTVSSASFTCIASSSAVEWTATVWMPSSRQARKTRRAISPRFAMMILSNIALLDQHQGFAIFDRAAILHIDLGDLSGPGCRDLVHRLHRFDDEERLAGLHFASDLDEIGRAWLRCPIDRADHGRLDGIGRNSSDCRL